MSDLRAGTNKSTNLVFVIIVSSVVASSSSQTFTFNSWFSSQMLSKRNDEMLQEIAVTSVLRDSLWCLLGPTVQVKFT